MNTSLFRHLGGLLLVASLVSLFGCKQDMQSPTNSFNDEPFAQPSATGKSGSTTTAAHPALTAATNVTVSRNTYAGITVWDSDGTHRYDIYRTNTPIVIGGSFAVTEWPCWSPTGASIAFLEYTSSSYSIKAIDVSVGAKGNAVGTNVRTLFTTSEQITGLAWCSQSATSAIAFTAQHTTSAGVVSEVYVMAQNGGTPVAIATQTNAAFSIPTWNPDDSKLAVMKLTPGTTNTSHLWVINTSNSALLEDDDVGGYGAFGCEWARSGNTIALSLGTSAQSPSNHLIYYIDYGSGAGPYTENVHGAWPTWSPNDASFLLTATETSDGSRTLVKIPAFGTTESTIMSPANNMLKWRR